jgi:dolichol-phosphate mannosyltransferase
MTDIKFLLILFPNNPIKKSYIIMAKEIVQLSVSAVVPCFNEEDVIESTYLRLKNIFYKIKNIHHEIIFVNDGSVDNTLQIITKISNNDLNVKIIDFARNFGQEAATSAGINNCNSDIAIILDADLQDPPEIIPEMIKLYLDHNCNVVYGVRKGREGETFLKKITSKFFYRIINYLSDIKYPVDTGNFRLIDKSVIEAFKKLPEKNKYVRGLISWVGFVQIPIYYKRDARKNGETKYNYKKSIRLALDAIFYSSKKPLLFVQKLGFCSVIVSLLLIVYVLISKFVSPWPGWTSIMIVIIFFGGVQLITIGIVGEYIGSIFDEVKNRPQYIINKKINFDK